MRLDSVPKFIPWPAILPVILLLLLLPPSGSAVSLPTRTYRLPLGELKYVLVDWLDRQGREVTVREMKMGRLELVVLNPGDTWKIVLCPQSALATEISLIGDTADEAFIKFEEALWGVINNYAGTNRSPARRPSGPTKVPAAITAKIGAVVCITTENNGVESQFSGFVIDDKGTIICTAHDLIKHKTIRVIDRHGNTYLGKVIKLDVTKDLALIRSRVESAAVISLAGGRQALRKDEVLYAIGCPMNDVGEIMTGHVDGLPVKAEQLHYWKISMATSPGSSGSAVFDVEGRLVGIIKGRLRGTNTTGFLIPMDRIRAFIDEL